tara:strand:- start:2948 stop:3829 length:882 start_codon:yes stop_codon:yes gene_type:complete
VHLTWPQIDELIGDLGISQVKVYGIPRGGAVVAGLARLRLGVTPVDNPHDAEFALDDIIDSGATAERIKAQYGLETLALIDKRDDDTYKGWVHFPWEEEPDQDIASSVTRMLEYIGEDPKREGLIETPRRVVESWKTLYAGYGKGKVEMRWFVDDTDEMIVEKGISFYSMCEHHMLPFFGTVAIGYIPNGQVVGISKLSRLVGRLSRKLQIQERLTRQVGEVLEASSGFVLQDGTQQPKTVKGVAVHVEAQHLCMMMRGVSQHGTTLVTNYLTGAFRDKPEARAEFLAAVNGG